MKKELKDNITMMCGDCSDKEMAKSKAELEGHADEEFLGKHVKIPFNTLSTKYPIEHMWIKVTKATSRFFSGTLANHPHINKELKHGDAIVFSRKQVEDVLPKFEKE